MRCAECSAETADAQFCVRCGAPIALQRPRAGRASSAEGGAVPAPADASTARPTSPAPYVLDSGGRVPPHIRRALRGYPVMALVAFAAGVAWAVFGYKYKYPRLIWGLPTIGLWWWAVVLFLRRIRFSRLLRRPGDARSATVRGGGHGVRLVVLGDGRLPSLEVHLPWWAPPETLLRDETVTVYGRESHEGALLISSPQRGRAFLGVGHRPPPPGSGGGI
jgi:hypothetical protein